MPDPILLDFRQRSRQKEIMDERILEDNENAQAYASLKAVNFFLGGRQVILHHLKKFSRKWKKGETLHILDIASGSADIPKAVVGWARRRHFKIQFTALDSNPKALELGKKETLSFPEISWVQASFPDLPFSPGSFDYVLSSLFFHHLPDPVIVSALRHFDSLAKRGIIINDLKRSPLAYAGFCLVSLLSPSPVFRYDGRVSILRGFRKNEILQAVHESGASYLNYYSHFAFRFALSGEKSNG